MSSCQKTSLSIRVNCSVRLRFYISFTFIYTTHKNKNEKKTLEMSKIKTLLTDLGICACCPRGGGVLLYIGHVCMCGPKG